MSAKEVLKTYARSSSMLPSLCVFSWIIVRKLTLFNFSNINIESMWVQYPERNEDVKLLGSSTVPWWGYADDLILFMLDINSLQRATVILDEVFTNYGLCIKIRNNGSKPYATWRWTPWYYNQSSHCTSSELYWI